MSLKVAKCKISRCLMRVTGTFGVECVITEAALEATNEPIDSSGKLEVTVNFLFLAIRRLRRRHAEGQWHLDYELTLYTLGGRT